MAPESASCAFSVTYEGSSSSIEEEEEAGNAIRHKACPLCVPRQHWQGWGRVEGMRMGDGAGGSAGRT